MYGLIGKLKTTPDGRDALASLLLDSARDMPGCLSYIVAEDPEDANALWVTEVWDSEESHAASLTLPAVQEVIGKGRSLIEGFEERHTTIPLGGHGLT